MSNSLQTPLFQAAAATFEELTLQVPGDVLDAEQRALPVDAGVAVDFEGPVSGTLELRVSAAVLPGLAINMMGEFDTPSEELQRDALGEVANVITGNVLPRLAGAKAVFRLHPPRAIGPASGPASAVADVALDDGRAELRLMLIEGAAVAAA
jgi:CheY-specific phosphatase CheX